MKSLYLGLQGYPHFTSSIQMDQPLELYINDNWLTDLIIQDSSKLLGNCNLSDNPLLGNLNDANLSLCTRNGLTVPICYQLLGQP